MNKSTVLVVEDNAVLQKVLELFAVRYGVHVKICTTGAEAVEAFNGDDVYCLIFMDWKLPDMDGLECTRMIRELELSRGLRVPIVAMTANVLSGDKERCLEAGMDDYLPKPFSGDQFKDMLYKWLSPTGARQAAI